MEGVVEAVLAELAAGGGALDLDADVGGEALEVSDVWSGVGEGGR